MYSFLWRGRGWREGLFWDFVSVSFCTDFGDLTDIGNFQIKACFDLYILSPSQVSLFSLSLYLHCFKVEQFGKKNKRNKDHIFFF